MKIKIKNLGAVRQATVEIKPLTVFIGPNNTGKTQTAYAIGGALGKWGVHSYTNAYINNELPETYPMLEEAVNKFLKEGNAKININDFLDRHGKQYFQNIANYTPKWIQSFFSTKRMSFEKFKISFSDWKEIRDTVSKNFFKTKVEGKLSVSETGEAMLTIIKEMKDDNFFIISHDKKIQKDLPLKEIKRVFLGTLFSGIQGSLFSGVFFFPAERTGFISFLLPLEKKTTVTPKPEPQAKILPAPISDMFETIVNIYFHGDIQKRIEEAKTQKDIKKYLELSKILQQEIIGGTIDFSTPDINLNRDLIVKWKGKENFLLDMPVLSSAVKDLTPLALYLNYTARQNHLIIIDEPEMNLHPKAQAQFVEFLAMMVNSGLHVLITTHSPYIVDHLANLIKIEKSKQKETFEEKLFLHRSDAVIAHDKVGVYLFGDKTAKNILNEDGSIDWDTFSSITDEIMQISLDVE